MPKTQRKGDGNLAGGGLVTTPNQGTVYANNKLVSVNGAKGTADGKCNDDNKHCKDNWQTTGGGPTVFAEGKPINKEGDPDTCDDPRSGGSPNVYNDAFQGGGAMFDNNPPYGGSPPPGAQPTPPAGYENNTTATVYVFESQDVPEEINPAPPGVNYSPVVPVESDPQQSVTNPPPFQNCGAIQSFPPTYNWSLEGFGGFALWAMSIQLSASFTAWDMFNGAVGYHEFTTAVIQPSGLSQKDILLNMCHHAKIVLEPMLTTYGSFIITSGYRAKAGSSQHNRGQATDIQFPSLQTGTKSAIRLNYFNLAKGIRDNVNFDQEILEWFGINPWIHISSNKTLHRGNILTQVQASPQNEYSPGLILMDT